jgi:hypothetical protein
MPRFRPGRALALESRAAPRSPIGSTKEDAVMTSAFLVMLAVLTTETYWRKRKRSLVAQPAAGIAGGHDSE